MKRMRDMEGDMANCLMLLSKVGESCNNGDGFVCKTCNREFLSFQALGGHRASHKRLKLMAAGLSSFSSRPLQGLREKKQKMHSCPICGIEFAIGQALGGHMRKHRAAMNDGGAKRSDHLCLDLNLTPYENDLNLILRTPPLSKKI
ncbi:zinc finger protein ZAT8-like [Lotus japonicus]|uniref:zinc finger protein ZAT8-like n=1 Tax=Lotus japonicus TaxID=34305 RepID=UPI0025872B33|nr:zinc finger protein ZAT8-like [Lotus japonicus]